MFCLYVILEEICASQAKCAFYFEDYRPDVVFVPVNLKRPTAPLSCSAHFSIKINRYRLQ